MGGVLIERMDFVHVFFVLKQERYVFRLVNIQNSSTWGRNYKKASSSFFQWGIPSPPLFTKVDTDVIHVIKWTRPSPSVFAYCKLSKLDDRDGKAWEQG